MRLIRVHVFFYFGRSLSNEPLTEMERSCGRQLYAEGEKRERLDAEEAEEREKPDDEDRRARGRSWVKQYHLIGVVLIICELGVMWHVGIDRICDSVILGGLFERPLRTCRVLAGALG